MASPSQLATTLQQVQQVLPLTMAELAGVSAAGGVPLSPPGLPVALPLLQRFPAVLLLDSTMVVVPDELATVWAGCGGAIPHHAQAAVKLGGRLDLVTGQLEGPLLRAGIVPTSCRGRM